MVLAMVLAMVGTVDTVGAMVEDTPHNPTWPTSKGNPSVTVWVRAALPLELGPVSSAECFSQTPLTIVCGTCFCASSMTVVNALLSRL